MNKLPLLLGAALLLAGSAHAQLRTLSVAAPTGVGVAPTIGATRGAAGAPAAPDRPAVGSTSPFNNDSYVQQAGTGQMATVSQTGGGKNTADIDQTSAAAGVGGNYASQKQESVSSNYNAPVDNQANIRQYGTGSTATQDQRGVQNKALVQQGSADHSTTASNNYASQTQRGPQANTNGNTANIQQNTTNSGSGNSATQTQLSYGSNLASSQQGSDNTSEQTQGPTGDSDHGTVSQTGNGNYAKQSQTGSRDRAEISQSGSSNQARQDQQGSDGDAKITQSTDGNFAEQLQIGGASSHNYAETTQYGNSSYSVETQTGSNNTVLVNQH